MTLEKQLDISTQFKVHHSEVREIYSPMEKIQVSCQSSQMWASQQIHSKVRLCNAQRN